MYDETGRIGAAIVTSFKNASERLIVKMCPSVYHQIVFVLVAVVTALEVAGEWLLARV